eukprot:10101355-Alexandrium_andersonii.AAC.1
MFTRLDRAFSSRMGACNAAHVCSSQGLLRVRAMTVMYAGRVQVNLSVDGTTVLLHSACSEGWRGSCPPAP